jgi:hypothetical protein
MSGILFVLEIAAFVVVAYWAFANDKAQPSTGDKGLLSMKGVAAVIGDAVAARQPKWKRTPSRRAAEASPETEQPADGLSQPKWKRQLRFNRKR